MTKDKFECLSCHTTWEVEHCPPNAQEVYHNQPMCVACGSKYVKWLNYEELRKKNFK